MCVVTALTACGSSNKDQNEAVNQDTDDIPVVTVPVETAVSGKAIKGVLANAKLTIYKYVNGEAVKLTSEELKEENLTTDANGNYTFTLLDYNGPVKVVSEVSTDTNSPTTMICDAPEGCGEVTFGSTINLTETDPEFKLSAVSNVTSGTPVVLNVSALTHFATALVENESSITTEVIQEKSSVIAKTFGIQGNITQLEPTNVESVVSVTAEDNDAELRYGFINAGFAQALFSRTTGEFSFSHHLAAAVSDVTQNDGTFLVNQTNDNDILNLESILNAAGDAAEHVADKIKQDANLSNSPAIDKLGLLETKLENEKQNQILLAGLGGRTNVVAEEVTEGDAIAKAKAMVADVRVISNLFDVTHSSNQDIVMQGERFNQLLDDASALVESEMDSFELLSNIADAVSQISMESENSNVTTYDLANYTNVAGITGTILFDKENYDFSVNASGNNSETANVALTLALDESGEALTLTMSGNVENNQVSFSIEEGSQVSVALSKKVTKAELEQGDVDVDILSGSMSLEAKLAQKATASVTNPISFEGKIVADLVMVEQPSLDMGYFDEGSYQSNYLGHHGYFEYEKDQEILPDSVTLSGSFQDAGGQHITATATVNLAGVEDFEYGEFEAGVGVPYSEPVISVTVSADGNQLENTYTDNLVRGGVSNVYNYENDNSLESGNYTITRQSIPAPGSDREPYSQFISLETGTTGDESAQTLNFIQRLYRSHSEGNYHYFYAAKVEQTVGGAKITHSSLFLDEEDYDANLDVENRFSGANEIIDANGNIIEPGVVEFNDNEFQSFDDLIEYAISGFYLSRDPRKINDISDYYQDILSSEPKRLYDTKEGVVMLVEEDIDKIKPGISAEPLNGIVIQPRMENALTIQISEDSHSVKFDLLDKLTLEFNTQENNEYDYNFERSLTDVELKIKAQRVYQTVPQVENGETRYNVIDTTTYQHEHDDEPYQNVRLWRVTYGDTDNNGVVGDDEWDVQVFYGTNLNTNGDVVDYEGEVVTNGFGSGYHSIANELEQIGLTFDRESGLNNELNSARHVVRKLHATALNDISYSDYHNPATYLSELRHTIDGVGDLDRFGILDEDTSHEAFTAGNTTSFDASIVYPDDFDKGETEDNYLDLTAALSLAFKVGDYDFDIKLSGERSELENGDLELAISYMTPEVDTQRSMTVSHDTKEEGVIGISNSDGVVIRMKEPDSDSAEDSNGEVVIGQIRVGINAVHAADIVKRGSVIMIVYKDDAGTVETL